MDALQLKVDSISGEVSQISDALRSYLEHGIASNRKVQPPRTKAGRDLLQQLLGRLDLVSTGLVDVRNLSPPASSSPSTPVTQGRDTTLSSYNQSSLSTVPLENKTPEIPAVAAEPRSGFQESRPSAVTTATPPAPVQDQPFQCQATQEIRLKDGSVYQSPQPSEHASPLFDCTYQDLHILNEELFELYSSHPVVRDRGYFKLQVRGLPPIAVQKVARPGKDHATSFCYKPDRLGLVKVDTGKRSKFTSPHLPLPLSAKMDWSLDEQRELWNSSAADPPKGNWPYIIGNPLFDDVELSPGQKLRSRGRVTLEGINTQYVYFNLTGKTITTMHREDAHVRSENLLRSGQHKFWCFVKPAFSKKLEERMAQEYPEMRRCSQAVRHLSRNIPPARLDEWGIEYTLDYCVPGQAVVTEPGTYHQVLNLGPNYAVAINLEYSSSPDMPPDYRFCDRQCPDKFAISADDFRIYEKPEPPAEEELLRTPESSGSREKRVPHPAPEGITSLRPPEFSVPQPMQSATPPPEQALPDTREPIMTHFGQPAVRLPDRRIPGRHEQGAPTPGVTRIEPFPMPYAEGKLVPLGPLDSPPMVQPVPAPDRSAPSERESAEYSSQPTRPPGMMAVFQPFRAQSTQVEVDPPAYESLAELPLPSSTPPMQQPQPPQQAEKNPFSGAGTYSLQTVLQPPPLVQQHNSHGYRGLRAEELPPIRKTARLVHPKRHVEMPAPNTSKRQRVEEPPPAQDIPAPGAFEHLTKLVRHHESARVESLIPEKLSGKPAFERLTHLVREWRRFSKSTPVVLGGMNLGKSVEATMHGYPELHAFLSRLFKLKLAECFERAMAGKGQLLSSQGIMDGMLRMLGWDQTRRHKLPDYLREGKCWKTICGKYDGLLCLMPSQETDCLDLALFKDKVTRLHQGLDTEFVRKMCAMGSILQRAIWDYLELPEFVWESAMTTLLLPDQILPLLAPFRLIKSNYFDYKCYYWPKPARWRWNWPIDPSLVMPGDQPCSLCTSRSVNGNQNSNHKPCRCIDTKVPRIPRISDDRSKGTGIRALGSHRANDMLGELVGELVPLGAFVREWTMELRRPDLDDEPVAAIYPRRMGNWVRKVCHSTEPSAEFRMMKISGRWRQMLVATRDIGDGEEITAKYGKGFLKEQPYDVVEGLR
ncbi:Lysine-specific demethylase 4E [Madurella mycetomatis]|uniref:Lysine-specific demethylase 4E n=1 Tax=Madurella mycetomatis TaxID=100816 RepID=A0A175WGG0_9PEZI|nr:Lysine-specific demethylase 4E [Madurella mycetomatis]